VFCRKRRSPSAGARPEDFEGEWSDVETRCSVAIEGHAAAKYVFIYVFITGPGTHSVGGPD